MGGVWCKGVQCLMMGDLKQIRIFQFKIYDGLHLCLWNTNIKKLCKALDGAPVVAR